MTNVNFKLKAPGGKSLLNEKDSTSGCAPLHLATRQGHMQFLDTLLLLGATVNTKNNDSQSPLHFAARYALSCCRTFEIFSYGRVNTVRMLLMSEAGPIIINDTDGDGRTALHIASENGHTKVVQALLHKGALLHKFDYALWSYYYTCSKLQRLCWSHTVAFSR